jgi:hypothetical protein
MRKDELIAALRKQPKWLWLDRRAPQSTGLAWDRRAQVPLRTTHRGSASMLERAELDR